MLIDTHCHLDDPILFDRLPEVIANAHHAGIDRFVVPGVTPEGWGRIASLADSVKDVFPAFGIHPMHACRCNEDTLSVLEGFSRMGVAIGEIGLDYLLSEIPREQQKLAFRGQLSLAVRLGLPVLIHCRRAFRDLLQIMREEKVASVGGIMHAYSGSIETARECIELGMAIAVSGPVTYMNAVRPVELVRWLPLEQMVLETDAPDMTPEPFRGMPNQPAYLLDTAKKIAEIKGVSLEETAEITTSNAVRLLCI
jgi:TatD DNase family protein